MPPSVVDNDGEDPNVRKGQCVGQIDLKIREFLVHLYLSDPGYSTPTKQKQS